MAQPIIVGLDIGTSSIKGVVGILSKKGKYRFLRAVRQPSSGMRKGMIVDMEDASVSLAKVAADIQAISRLALKNVFANIGSAHVDVKNSKGFVVVSRADDVISHEDVERVIQASQAIPLSANRTVVHVIPREFVVDGIGDIRDAVGLSGARLEVESFIISAFSPVLKNIHKCAESAGLRIFGLIFGPLASAKAVLSKTQMELGSVLLDFGASTTGLAVFEEGKLLHAKVFPLGSAHVTNDIAIGIKAPIAVAESIKLSFGAAQSKEISRRDYIDLAKMAAGIDGIISRRFISEIVETRLAEIVDVVNNELKHIGRHAQLPGGAVLVGGGAKLPGMVDFIKQELRLPAQIGVPTNAAFDNPPKEFRDSFDDPEMALAFGLFLWGAEERTRKSFPLASRGSGVLRFLRQFLP
ncbi:MAG: cell division protein FtsA [Parcubacteria group bacterium RIFCSPLOWO2_01_FULL_48_18]|nr:MAG: cell division protein FtsA [Parcubacteria group bacterium RIFCSPHIGHO2_02_FULL_48_10b]OHB22017.1 MAG: cell division protein FtsA [Parcubacteria group bacterium RIFCSPLOWO2_01_FULL_48_18]